MAEDIAAKAMQTFQENLKYLEQNHKDIYDKIVLLNALIAEGKYTEKYALDYKEEGYFDILELSTNEYLYKENSIQNAQRVVDSYDLKRKGGVFKAQKYVYASSKQAEEIDKSDLSFHNTLWATIKIINYTSEIANSDTSMIRVNKIIFLGIGLGLHIKGIMQIYNPRVIFVKEKNLETFRLALFVTNFKEVFADNAVYFSLTDDLMNERKNFIEFLNTGNNYNLYMKHIPFTQDYQLELQRLQSHVLSQSYINYGYSAMLLRYIDSPKYLVQDYSFINMMQRYYNPKSNILSKKPVLMVFSGPSTSKNIDWLKENRDRFILVSALSTCRLLNNNGITPDIVIHVDPGEDTALLFEGLNAQEYFKDTIALLASNVDEKTMQRFNKEKIHFIEQGTNYKKGFGHFSAPSVGEYTYGAFLIFGISKMYMLGVDLALDPDTMQTHGGYHPFQKTGKVDTTTASLDPNASVEYVKGNFLEQVPTLSAYQISIEQAITFTKMLKKEHHQVYNLSNGAYIDGVVPLHVQDYDWNEYEKLNKQEIRIQLEDFFDSISEAKFNDEDKAQLKYQIKEAKKLEKIIKAHKKKKFVNADAYLNSLAQLSWDLSDMENKTKSDLAQVYYEYFPIMMSYIFDMFNTEDLKNSNKHIVQINNILVTQLLKMSKLYIDRLEYYLK